MRTIAQRGFFFLLVWASGCAAEQPEHALSNDPTQQEAAGQGGEQVEPAKAQSASAGSTASTGESLGGGSGGAPSSGDAASITPNNMEPSTPEGGAIESSVPVDHGKEYLWIDQTFHWTDQADANVGNTGPKDWYDSSGVDYYDGKIEFRVTVTSKADTTPVWHELCQWQNALGDAAHVCLHCLSLYSQPGEYTCETTAAAQGGPVDYHKPFVAVQNRVKDGTTGRGADLTTEKKGLPIDYHYTVVIVPKTMTFSGWSSYPVK